MLPGEFVDHDNICSYFEVISKGNIKRCPGRAIVIIGDGSPERLGGGWIDGAYHYRTARDEPAPWEQDTACEWTRGLPRGLKTVLEAANESQPVHLFEKLRKGTYRFAGSMRLESAPTSVQHNGQYFWNAVLVRRAIDLPSLKHLPLGASAVVGHTAGQDIDDAVVRGLRSIAGRFCYRADEPLSWPGHMQVFPKGAIAVVGQAITTQQHLQLSKFLDVVSARHRVPCFDQRNVAQQLSAMHIDGRFERVAQRKRAIVRGIIAKKRRADPTGSRFVDDDLDFTGSSDQEILAALSLIGDDDQFEAISQRAENAVRMPDLDRIRERRLVPTEPSDSSEPDVPNLDIFDRNRRVGSSNIKFR